MSIHRRYTLLIKPNDSGKVRSLGGPVTMICVLVPAFIAALVIWSLGSTYLAAWFNAGRLAELERRNADLAGKIQTLSRETMRYKQDMGRLVQREKEARIAAGLPDIHPDIRLLGVGGGVAMPVAAEADSMLALTNTIYADLSRLLREIRLEEASLSVVEKKARGDRAYWRHMPTVMPTEGRTSSRFGMRNDPITGDRRMHSGVDIAAGQGNAVRATADGTVVYTGVGRNYGRFVDIDHHNGYKTRYGHLSQITVKKNTEVSRGDVIGLVGNTGRATGYHLHYEVRHNNRATNPVPHFYPEKMVVD